MKTLSVLVVDCDMGVRRAFQRVVSQLGDVEVSEATTVEGVHNVFDRTSVDIALVNLSLDALVPPQQAGFFRQVGEIRANMNAGFIVVGGAEEFALIRAATKIGADHYILKEEFSEGLLLSTLRRICSERALQQKLSKLRDRAPPLFAELVGSSRMMQRLRAQMERVGMSDRPVLVRGPTGAGKEVVVRAIHCVSARADEPFLDLNCSALPAPLIESELFGHLRGAFTGADRKRIGFLSAVGKGTLFLDEVAELPFEVQSKLLRVLEDGSFRPLGSTAVERFEGRVIAATHRNLEVQISQGKFRDDLYYRLNVLEVQVPPLSEHREDVPALVAHFAGKQPRPLTFTEGAMEVLLNASWPGNVRQLRNTIDRLSALAPDTLITAQTLAELAVCVRAQDGVDVVAEFARAILLLQATDKLALAEAALIEQAMRLSDGNMAAAARLLGVHRKSVERRVHGNGDNGKGRLVDLAREPKRSSDLSTAPAMSALSTSWVGS